MKIIYLNIAPIWIKAYQFLNSENGELCSLFKRKLEVMKAYPSKEFH